MPPNPSSRKPLGLGPSSKKRLKYGGDIILRGVKDISRPLNPILFSILDMSLDRPHVMKKAFSNPDIPLENLAEYRSELKSYYRVNRGTISAGLSLYTPEYLGKLRNAITLLNLEISARREKQKKK